MIEPFSAELTSNYSNGYFPDRVGSSLQWGSNIREMVRGRENLTHKCSGTTSNKIGSIFLYQTEKGESHTLSDKQQDSLVLPFENGGNKEQTYDQIEQRYLALSSKLQYGYDIRIPAFNTEYSSRQRKKPDSSEWLLHPKVFQAVSQLLGSPPIYLFASRLCHQLPQYIAWHPDPCSQGTDAMIQNWNIGLPYAFPPFSMISRVLLKIKQECVPLLILIAPVWSTQPWYPELLNLCVREPVLLPQGQEILISPKNIVHPLMGENSLTLAAWLVSGQPFCVKEFQRTLLTLSQIPDEKVHSLIMSQPGENGLAGGLNEKLMTLLFNDGNEYRTINLQRSAISASMNILIVCL